MDDRYFTEEMNYLLDLSREYSRHHSDKAQMLHLADARSRDPNVELLFESFAFLTSRIRERLDNDFPQIADGLFSFIWPGYVNFLPACCLVEFSPSADAFSEAVTIARGALIDSDPVEKNIQCRFSTTQDTVILPLALLAVSAEMKGSTSVLNMTFQIHKDADRAVLANHSLKINIVDAPLPSWQLYDLLLGMNGDKASVDGMTLTAFTADHKPAGSWELGPNAIASLGLTQDELLLPTNQSTLWRFELLRDFFLLPAKFAAFKLDVLRRPANQPEIDTFTIAFNISREWPSNFNLSKEQFRLNTVPMVNLFPHEAAPIRLSRAVDQYTVKTDPVAPEYYQVYGVDKVDSVEGGRINRVVYTPRYSPDSPYMPQMEGNRAYILDRNKAPWGDWETNIRFFNSSIEDEFSEDEIVSLSITCANGRLADKLVKNQIHFPVTGIKEDIEAQNPISPTPFCLPDLEQISRWRWMSHAALNYMSLKSPERLKSMLLLHDFTNGELNRRKVDGIKSVDLKSTRMLSAGALIPCIVLELTMQEEHFVHLGEIQLFAKVLSVFLASFATINSSIQLVVTTEPSKHKIIFEPVMGENLCL